MMTNDLAASYPTGDYLEGNFITYYTSNYTYFDRFIVKLFGERGIEVDKDAVLADVAIEWTYDINAIVFTHMVEWAKMYSASIKDYEPLWNVDGTVETTYGATHKEDVIAGRDASDIMGARHKENIVAARHEEDIIPSYTDTDTTSEWAYPDGLEHNTQKVANAYGAHTNQHNENTYTDQENENTYTDRHTQNGYTDQFDEDEHTETERRTGNIGVTKSTDLVESEFNLRSRWAFYKIIFSYILNEVGAHYYD